jgi:hypothetical protein
MPRTTIEVDTATRDRLKRYKRGPETYDDVLTALMDESEREAYDHA